MPQYRLKSRSIVHERIGDEVIAAHLETGTYYSIPKTGAPVWELLVGGCPQETIEELFVSQFGESAREDLSAFFQKLEEKALIEPAPESSFFLPERLIWPSEYTPPSVETYEEIQELLKLDPIHEVDEMGWPHRHE